MNHVLPRSTPQAEGLSAKGIERFLTEIEQKQIELHSLMILRHGRVVAEGWWKPYEPQTPHLLYSLSKSFTSTAIGFAVEEGLLSIDDTVISFFPEKLPVEISDNLAAMTVRHLLTMTTGQPESERPPLDWSEGADWISDFLAQPVKAVPGTKFDYSTPATFMCSAILHKTAGIDLLDYLMPRLFEPLGIERPTWQSTPAGISFGGFGLSLKTESIAKFGQLLLQKGEWNGKQVVPAHWIEQATSKQVENGDDANSDWQQGYGFQFWQCRHGAYRGDGAFGQYCVVHPATELVVAITSSTNDMQSVLNAIWDHILTAHSEESQTLLTRLATLELPGPIAAKAPKPSLATYVDEAGKGTWSIAEAHEGVVLAHSGNESTEFKAGFNDWVSQPAVVEGREIAQFAGKAAWTSEDVLTAEFHDLASPMRLTLKLTFTNEQLEVATKIEGRFGPDELPSFTGKLLKN